MDFCSQDFISELLIETGNYMYYVNTLLIILISLKNRKECIIAHLEIIQAFLIEKIEYM